MSKVIDSDVCSDAIGGEFALFIEDVGSCVDYDDVDVRNRRVGEECFGKSFDYVEGTKLEV